MILLYFNINWSGYFWKIHYILQMIQVVLNFYSNIDLYRCALILKNMLYKT